MDTQQSVMVAAAVLVSGGAVWAAAVWWFSRKLRQAEAGLDRTEKARQFAAQQAAQARRQIEAMQKELADLRHAVRTQGSRSAVAMPPQAIRPPHGGDETEMPGGDDEDSGFADTQLLPPLKP